MVDGEAPDQSPVLPGSHDGHKARNLLDPVRSEASVVLNGIGVHRRLAHSRVCHALKVGRGATDGVRAVAFLAALQNDALWFGNATCWCPLALGGARDDLLG